MRVLFMHAVGFQDAGHIPIISAPRFAVIEALHTHIKIESWRVIFGLIYAIYIND